MVAGIQIAFWYTFFAQHGLSRKNIENWKPQKMGVMQLYRQSFPSQVEEGRGESVRGLRFTVVVNSVSHVGLDSTPSTFTPDGSC